MDDDKLIEGAPGLWGQLYIARLLAGDSSARRHAIADEAARLYGPKALPLREVREIEAQLTQGSA